MTGGGEDFIPVVLGKIIPMILSGDPKHLPRPDTLSPEPPSLRGSAKQSRILKKNHQTIEYSLYRDQVPNILDRHVNS